MPSFSPAAPGAGQAVAGWGLWLFSPLLSECLSPVKFIWAGGSSFGDGLSGTGRPTLTARVTQRQPAGPTMTEVLLGVTALYLHRPSKGGGGVSAGPDTFRTFTPVSSLSLVPLGNADLLLISVQPHWHRATLHSKNLSHCIASNLL